MIIIPILEKEKTEVREVEWLAQGHTAVKRLNHDVNSVRFLIPKHHPMTESV